MPVNVNNFSCIISILNTKGEILLSLSDIIQSISIWGDTLEPQIKTSDT